MSIIINPGSGPVGGATLENARLSMGVFAEDVERKLGRQVTVEGPLGDEDAGRWTFSLVAGERGIEVEMPGLPPEQVRYLGEPQNIWDYPRLYVDGGSWVWAYGLNVAVEILLGEEEEDA